MSTKQFIVKVFTPKGKVLEKSTEYLHLPGKSGIDICREINEMEVKDRPHIVILSADTNDAIVKEAYELGVGDYICKPFNVTAFQERMLRFSRDIRTFY